jgi:hypothetical protein
VTVTLCGVDDEFSKSIVTVPADAFSDVWSNINDPFAAAWSVTFDPPADLTLAVGEGTVGVVAGVGFVAGPGVVAPGVTTGAGVVLGVEVELDDPHPARAKAPTTQVRDDLRSPVFNGCASDCCRARPDSRRCRRSPAHPASRLWTLLESSAESFNPVPRGQEGMNR